jgi:hypothetical protein
LIYKCGGIDKRTIEKFEKVESPHLLPSFSHLIAELPLGGAIFASHIKFCARTFLAANATTSALLPNIINDFIFFNAQC